MALLFYLNEGEQLPELFGFGYLGWYALAFFALGLSAIAVGFLLLE